MDIVEARKRAGFTQEEVARRLKLTTGAIAQWETGRCFPKRTRILEVARLYGCTVDELLRSDEKENVN